MKIFVLLAASKDFNKKTNEQIGYQNNQELRKLLFSAYYYYDYILCTG